MMKGTSGNIFAQTTCHLITLRPSVCDSIRQKILLGGPSKLHSSHPDLEARINAFSLSMQ